MKILREFKQEDLVAVIEDLKCDANNEFCPIAHKNPLIVQTYNSLFTYMATVQHGRIAADNFGCLMHLGMEIGYMLAHREIDNEILEKEMLVPIVDH